MFGNSDESIDSLGRQSWFQNSSELFKSWMTSVSTVILDPFYTVIRVSISAVFIFIGARLLIASGWRSVTYSTILKILAIGLIPTLFVMVPYLGTLIASIWTLVLVVVGIEQVLGASRGVAIVVALFPKLLVFFLAAGALFLLLGGFLTLLFS